MTKTAGKKKRKSLIWSIRKDWWHFLDSIIPHWCNEASYDLDCEIQEKNEAQRLYTWLWWFIIVNIEEI